MKKTISFIKKSMLSLSMVVGSATTVLAAEGDAAAVAVSGALTQITTSVAFANITMVGGVLVSVAVLTFGIVKAKNMIR